MVRSLCGRCSRIQGGHVAHCSVGPALTLVCYTTGKVARARLVVSCLKIRKAAEAHVARGDFGARSVGREVKIEVSARRE